ncbi:MAG: hypothetical protein V1712_04425 [Patescibacteria group bacterium]
MKNYLKLFTKFFVVIVLLIFPFVAGADIGPKPSAYFRLEYHNIAPITVVEATLIQCKESNCSDATPLPDYGPQHFSCTNNSCETLSYGFTPYQRLVIKFSDNKIRESNIFSIQDVMNASYTVNVRNNDLVVTTSLLPSFFSLPLLVIALFFTIFIELIAGAILIGITFFFLKIPGKTLGYLILANIISLPVLWLALPTVAYIFGSYNWGLYILEIFVVFFEAYFIYRLIKKITVFWKLLILSIIVNFISFIFGSVVGISF